MLFALALEDERLTILHRPTVQEPDIQLHLAARAEDHPVVPELRIRKIPLNPGQEEILDAPGEPGVNLAIGIRGRTGKRQLRAHRSIALLFALLILLIVPLVTVLARSASR